MNKQETVLLMFVPAFSRQGTEEFFEKELPYLSGQFKKIEIFSFDNSFIPADLPSNVSVSEFRLYKPYNRIRFLFKHFWLLISLFIKELLFTKFHYKYVLSPIKNFNLLMNKLNDSENFIKYCAKYENQKIIMYSYWFNHWAGVCALAKHLSSDFNHRLITRIHGGDYQLGQRPEGYFPFRNIEIFKIDLILSVSNYASHYLFVEENFYGKIKEVKTSYLGVFNHGDNEYKPDSKFVIVSCSSLIPLKRVHLIIETLKCLKINVKWVHFGDGPLMAEMQERAKELPANIEAEFKGWVKNTEVFEYYKHNKVDLFINSSEYEGIPVSLMEAISFGIPIVGANICGVPEIVTTSTGYLIEKDFEPKQLADLITWLYDNPNYYLNKRKKVKSFWNERFNAENNYSKLPDLLVQ